MLLALKTHNLHKFIDASIVPPPQHITNVAEVTKVNPDVENFERQDNAFSSWLLFFEGFTFSNERSMKHFLMKIKLFCENSTSCGEVISEHEHITTILNGLSLEYESVITVISTNQVFFSLQGFTTILLDVKAQQQSLVVDVNVGSPAPL
ncbi:hypothetical protein Golob_002234 [Gossypium lobatum]|uniref:Uncharacterized protein n=1 Tax=Gossypium lobatum TaxID=34289 RepID=A0A7J8N4N1_9ROSI|nr:hypothetical protein [Gossypium lobatum]